MKDDEDPAGPLAPVHEDDLADGDMEWAEAADVVVVGLGAAGAATAIAAAEAGSTVLVLERTGGGGGTSATSGGILYLGGGTATQAGAGWEDTPAEMLAFLSDALGRPADDPRLVAYCDASVQHHDWLVGHGVPFRAEFWPEPGMEPPGTEGLVFSGGEDAAPYRSRVRPAPRGHVPTHPDAAGGFLMECLLDALRRTSARVLTEARARRLVVDDSGTVLGVTARVDGREVAVRAPGGVVLASGGWAHNDALVERHVPELLRVAWRLGTDNDDGWGLRVGVGAGGQAVDMGSAEVALPISPPRSMVRGILVNAEGRRFVNEDTYFGHVGQAALLGQAGHAYLLVDEPRYQVNRAGMRATWVCGSWEELAGEIGVPAEALVRTVTSYNESAARGEDPLFGKSAEFLVPLDQPPFGAYDLRPDATIYAGFPLGGVATDAHGAVLDDTDTPATGLWAVGRVAGSLARERYCSGVSLGEGTFFGRRAGEAAAARARDGAGTEAGARAGVGGAGTGAGTGTGTGTGTGAGAGGAGAGAGGAGAGAGGAGAGADSS